MTTATMEHDYVDDTPPPGTDNTPATGTPKTWKDLSGISFKFNSHDNAAYKNVHDALNDIYADALNHTNLEPFFTDTSFMTLKTQSANGINALHLLTDIIHACITAIANPGSTNSDSISEILRECSLSFVNQTRSQKTISSVNSFFINSLPFS